MTATDPLKKWPYTKERMAQADPPKGDSTVKKMNVQSLLPTNDML